MSAKVSRSESQHTTKARFIETARGIEVRCEAHGHLLGIFTTPGVLQIKCRGDEHVAIDIQVPR
jgi:hypothetical protein